MDGVSWDLSKAKGHGTRGIIVETFPADEREPRGGVVVAVSLYDTVIGRLYADGWLELRAGGWHNKAMTVAALDRLCYLVSAPAGVYRRKKVTYLGTEIFFDGIGVQGKIPVHLKHLVTA